MDFVLRRALEELVEHVEFYSESMRPNWIGVRFKFVLLCLQEDIVSEEDLKAMVRKRILAWGRENYDWLLKKNAGYTKWPDHAPCSPALAFAISQGELSRREIARIRFDHGDTAETFVKHYPEDIVSTALSQILKTESFSTPATA